MPPLISEKVEVPQNETQPDREAQLDGDLSKLFDTPAVEAKPEVKEPPKEIKKEVVTEKPKEEPKVDTNKVQPEKVEKDDKPSSKEGWKVLRESHAQAKKTIAEKEAEVAKLQAAMADKGQATSKELEELKKERDDLKSYRAMVDIQADPEFTEKFDNPIAKKTEQVSKMLTEWGVAQGIIEKIDYTDASLLDRISDTIAENKDKISAKKFLRHAEEINELYDKKAEHLDEYKKNYKNILETKKKESFAKQAESEGRVQKHLQTIADLKDDKGESRFPFLSEQAAKDPTNAAEVEQVSRHNKAVATMRGILDNALKAETPEDRAELAVAAVSAHWTTAQLKAAMRKIESLQGELAKVSKVTSETPRSQKPRTVTNGSNGEQDMDLDTVMNNWRSGL